MALIRSYRIAALIAACAVLLSTSTAQARDPDAGRSARSATAITVMINGQRIALPSDRQPYIVNGRTLFPLRYLLEYIGATVDWGYPSEHDAQVAWVQIPDTLMGFPIGQNYMTFDGEYVLLDQGAVLSPNDYTMVPLRHVVERLGGTASWDQNTRTASFNLTLPKQKRSVREKCSLHGYNYDAKPSAPGACTGILFWVPDALTAYGHDRVKEWGRSGLTGNSYAVQYLNRIAMLHQGQPPRSAMEALDATVEQVLIDIAIAEAIGMIWHPEEPDATGKPKAGSRTYSAYKPPERNGWGFPDKGQFMSEESIQYQSEISSKPYRLIRAGTNGTHNWEIEEYGFGAPGKGKIWFDALDGDTLIDAKALKASSFVGRDGKLDSFFTRFPDKGAQQMLQDAMDQIKVVDNIYKIRWYFKDKVFMDAWISWLQEQGAWDVLKGIEHVFRP